MIEVYTTVTFDELFLKLPKKLQIKSDEKTKLFKENPFNPILRTEKLHPKGHEVWSFRVDISYRVVFKFTGRSSNDIYNYNIFG